MTTNGYTVLESGIALSPRDMELYTQLVRPRIVIDAGNRFIKRIDAQGRVRLIVSYVKQLHEWEDATWDEESVIVEVDNKRYAIGKVAKELGGVPIFSESKTDWAWLLGYVALEPNPGQNTLIVEELIYFLPDTRHKPSVEGVKKIETIASAKEFRRNGQEIVATVRKVVPTDETRGTYCYAIRNGLFNYPHLTNGIINVGGGDVSCHVYLPNQASPEKAVIDRGVDLNLVGKGTVYLAEMIASALQPKMGTRPSTDWIMDGIADESYTIAQTGTYFKPEFNDAHERWWKELKGQIKTGWTRPLSTMGEVLVIGGSATLLNPLIDAFKGRWRIPAKESVRNFSQVIDLYGMMEVRS